jgi:hypothetical protein
MQTRSRRSHKRQFYCLANSSISQETPNPFPRLQTSLDFQTISRARGNKTVTRYKERDFQTDFTATRQLLLHENSKQKPTNWR